MSATLEQLARLFCNVEGFSPDDRIPTTDINGRPATYPRWKEYLDLAREAQAIMRRETQSANREHS